MRGTGETFGTGTGMTEAYGWEGREVIDRGRREGRHDRGALHRRGGAAPGVGGGEDRPLRCEAELRPHRRRTAERGARIGSVCEGPHQGCAQGRARRRVGSPSLPGARNGAWVKHKHRRTESFLVSGWSAAERRRPESLLLARAGPDGGLESGGSVPFVLANGQADDVRRQLEPLVLPPTRRGQRMRRLAPALRATVAFHGPPRGAVRDPILRAVAPLEPPRSS
jgi:hypothetical protein